MSNFLVLSALSSGVSCTFFFLFRTRLVAVATQKFIADVATDALQYVLILFYVLTLLERLSFIM